MKLTKKPLIIMLLMCFIAVSLLSLVILAMHSHCYCIKHLCDVCPKLFKKREVLGQFMNAVSVMIIICAGLFAAFSFVMNSDLIRINPANIVEAGIKMSN